MEIGDEPLTMVVLTIGGEVGGNLILLFDELNGRQLAASLLGRGPGTEPEWTDLEKSALTETGNILGCAYINALTRLIGTRSDAVGPLFHSGLRRSVLQQAVMTQALADDRLLLCQIGFRRKDQQLDWRVVFVPTLGMQEAMRRSLHGALESRRLTNFTCLDTHIMTTPTTSNPAKEILVGMGEVAAGQAPQRMKAILGSCIGVALYHPGASGRHGAYCAARIGRTRRHPRANSPTPPFPRCWRPRENKACRPQA